MKKAYLLILCLMACTFAVSAQKRAQAPKRTTGGTPHSEQKTPQAPKPSTGGTPSRVPQNTGGSTPPRVPKSTGGGTAYGAPSGTPQSTGGGTAYGAPFQIHKPSTGGHSTSRPAEYWGWHSRSRPAEVEYEALARAEVSFHYGLPEKSLKILTFRAKPIRQEALTTMELYKLTDKAKSDDGESLLKIEYGMDKDIAERRAFDPSTEKAGRGINASGRSIVIRGNEADQVWKNYQGSAL